MPSIISFPKAATFSVPLKHRECLIEIDLSAALEVPIKSFIDVAKHEIGLFLPHYFHQEKG